MSENRIIAPQKQQGEEETFKSMRPQSLDDFVGQRQLCQNLRQMMLFQLILEILKLYKELLGVFYLCLS